MLNYSIEKELANFFYKCPDGEYFRVCGPSVSGATPQLCHWGEKAAIDDVKVAVCQSNFMYPGTCKLRVHLKNQ